MFFGSMWLKSWNYQNQAPAFGGYFQSFLQMNMAFDLPTFINQTKAKSVIIAYHGPLTDVIMSEVSRDIRTKFADNPRICRKIFAIFIELAQNILFYSAEKVNFGYREDSVGGILIAQDNQYYHFVCGNRVESVYMNELLDNCRLINTLDREGLRQYKRQQRSRPSNDRSRGAGIGLIQVAITSENPLQVVSDELNDKFSLFSLSVKVKK